METVPDDILPFIMLPNSFRMYPMDSIGTKAQLISAEAQPVEGISQTFT
jgi:hypothetical protein